jgi:hypothetical protein
MFIRRSILLLPVALLVSAAATLAAPEKVAPNRNWVAVIRDEKLKKAAPKSGLITDAKTFEKVWKAWRKDEKVPAIDFKKEFVVVTLVSSGPNRPKISASLDEGKLTIKVVETTQKAAVGFGYSLATFNCKGIKSINGKELPKPK